MADLEQPGSPSPARRLWRENRPAARLLYGATLASLLATACWLAIAWTIAQVVSRVFIDGQGLAEVLPLLLAMLGLGVLRATLGGLAEVLDLESALRVKTAMRSRLSIALLERGPVYARGERAGELVHTIVQGVEILDAYIRLYLPARWLAGLVPLLVLLVILVIDPFTLPILLFAGPILVLLLALIGARTRELTRRRERELAWMSAHFLDVLQGLPTLKMFGRSKEQRRTIEAISTTYGSMTMDVLRTAFQTSLVLEWGATAATALVAITVSVRLMAGAIPFDQALTVLILTPEFFLPLRQLATHYHAGAAGTEALDRIYTVLGASGELPGHDLILPVAAPAEAPSTMGIHFEDVSFSYGRGSEAALDGLSLHIEPGLTTALVGETGSGKSTLVSLLLRFVAPAKGRISVSGVSLEEIDADRWREEVAWVPQHPYLLNGSILDNLKLGRPDAGMAEIGAAAKAACAQDFILALPRGYETPVGEMGARLSGGQVQRIALARAFLKDAPLLILDEATSHLDTETEAAVCESVRRLAKGRAVLVISHAELPVQYADVIVRLDRGRIVETARRDLLTSGGLAA